jgi:O-antigen/teichoic acid export membrane protein
LRTGKREGDAYHSLVSVLGATITGRVLQFGSGIIVARLLAPEELGRFFLVAAVLGMIELTSQSGLARALIQGRDREERVWQSVWNFGACRGAALALILFFSADGIADLLRAPEIAPLLQVVSVIPLLKSLNSLSLVKAQRAVTLSPITRLGIISQLSGTAASILLVAVTRSAWGMVGGLLLSTLIVLVGSWRVAGFRPGRAFSTQDIRELFRFGRWHLLSSALWWASAQGDNLIVGRSLGTGQLGIYGVAFGLAQLPTTLVTNVTSQVMFPALARSQRDSSERAKALFERYLLVTAGVSGLFAALIAGAAVPIVETFLGQSYAAAVVPIIIMAAGGYARALAATGGTMFAGVGRPAYDTAMQALRALVLVSALVALLRFGVVGAAVASLCSVVALVPLWLAGLSRLGISPGEVCSCVAHRLPAALVCGAAATLSAQLVTTPIASLLLSVLVGGLSWLLVSFLIDRALLHELSAIGRRTAGSSASKTIVGRTVPP